MFTADSKHCKAKAKNKTKQNNIYFFWCQPKSCKRQRQAAANKTVNTRVALQHWWSLCVCTHLLMLPLAELWVRVRVCVCTRACVRAEFASVCSVGKWARKLEVSLYKMNLLCSKALSRGQTEKWRIWLVLLTVGKCVLVWDSEQWAWKERLCVYLFTMSLRSCSLFDHYYFFCVTFSLPVLNLLLRFGLTGF